MSDVRSQLLAVKDRSCKRVLKETVTNLARMYKLVVEPFRGAQMSIRALEPVS
jgi:hypothetical protein